MSPWKSVAQAITLADCFGFIAPTVHHRPSVPTSSLCAVRSIDYQSPLETRLRSECFVPVDIRARMAMIDFIFPNEGGVVAIQPHLNQAFANVEKPNYLVATGAERALFALLLAGNACQGVIIRDINPRIKAYIDFNVLLLRLSENRTEYVELSSSPDKKAKIYQKLAADRTLSAEVKSYYQQHFDDFAMIYFDNIEWKQIAKLYDINPFREVNYYDDDVLFERLKRFATSGNIVATIGNIGSLESFYDLPVAAIDISNIQNFELVDLRWPHAVHVIWTRQHYAATSYFSNKAHPISGAERELCKNVIDIFRKSGEITVNGVSFQELPTWLDGVPPLLSRELFAVLRQNCLYSDKFGWLSEKKWKALIVQGTISKASVEDLRKLSMHPNIKKILRCLVQNWIGISGEQYAALSGSEGWQEAFRDEVRENANSRYFISWLKRYANSIRPHIKIAGFPDEITPAKLIAWAMPK
jgi:hypothetical protein